MTEKIKCDGCGMIREWHGMHCLTICDCMKEQKIVEDIDDQKNGQVDAVVILPCPFCGGEAKVMFKNDESYMDNAVYCKSCYCQSPRRDKKEAIRLWNTRSK